MAHRLVDPPVGMRCVVAGVMNHRPFEVQGEKPCAEENGQRQSADEPSPDGEHRQEITTQKQRHGGIPHRWGINELPRNRSIARSDLTELLSMSRALVHPEIWHQS